MSLLAFVLCAIAALAPERDRLAHESQGASEEPKATIYGRVFWLGDHKSPDQPVYLFDWEQSAPLRRLLRKTNMRLRSLGADNIGTHTVEGDFYDKAADLVPKLPLLAKARSDKSGAYSFSEVPPGKRYYVVSLDISEDGVFYAAAPTPVVKPGERLRVDIRRVNLWYAE